MKCEIIIDNKPFSFEVEGDFFWGKDEVLFKKEGSIIEHTEWHEQGFNLLNAISDEHQKDFVNTISEIIKKIFIEIGIKFDEKNFDLQDYHKYTNDKTHNEVIQKTRFLKYSDFPAGFFDNIAKKVSENLKKEVSFNNPLLEKEIVILRISRPNSLDINPPHRDGYLDIWKDILNLWIPISGCNENSSLPLIPKSHLWNEKDIMRTSSKGASINGLTYHVPAIVKSNNGLGMIRPNPQKNEILIFSPFLLHGAAINLNNNTTRMSLELRLCKK
jgi:hypothetical protein